MAVEASHFTLFSPPNMEMIYQNNASMYNDELQPSYGTPAYAFPATLSRKRSRDSSSFIPVPFSVQNVDRKENRISELLTVLAGDISSQMYQQQSEIDGLISHHTEKVRSEMEQMRKKNTMRMITAITKRLKTKEDEYLKIGRLNWTLEEKVKSLNIENQILKELVQTNEATANALRNKLQQVLAQIQQQQRHHFDSTDDDAQSYCQVAEDDGEGERKVSGNSNDENEDCKTTRSSSRYGRMNRWCRRCEKEESCVLLLPCRHLCVCTLCISSISFCPVCNVAKTAGVIVNMCSSLL